MNIEPVNNTGAPGKPAANTETDDFANSFFNFDNVSLTASTAMSQLRKAFRLTHRTEEEQLKLFLKIVENKVKATLEQADKDRNAAKLGFVVNAIGFAVNIFSSALGLQQGHNSWKIFSNPRSLLKKTGLSMGSKNPFHRKTKVAPAVSSKNKAMADTINKGIEAKENIKSINGQLKPLNKKKDTLLAEKEKLQLQKKESVAENKRLEEKGLSARQARGKALDELDLLKQQKIVNANKQSRVDQEIRNVEGDLKKMGRQINTIDSRISSNQKQIADLKQKLKGTPDNEQTQADRNKIEHLEGKNDNLTARKQDLAQQRADTRDLLPAKKAASEKLKETGNTLDAEIKFKEQHIQTLDHIIDPGALNKKMADNQEALDQVEVQIMPLKEKLADAEKKKSELDNLVMQKSGAASGRMPIIDSLGRAIAGLINAGAANIQGNNEADQKVLEALKAQIEYFLEAARYYLETSRKYLTENAGSLKDLVDSDARAYGQVV